MGRGRIFRAVATFVVAFGLLFSAFPTSAFGATLEKEIEPELKRVVVAETVEELMWLIDDNMTIVLKPGVYNITDYINSMESYARWEDEGEGFPGVYVNEVFDGLELIISGFNNVSIISEDKKNPAEIVIEPRYADVLSFEGCSNILIDSVIAGHTPEQGSCAGDVLSLEHCDNVVISNSELYGCGTYAFDISHSNNISAIDCDVHDCTYGCTYAQTAKDLIFTRCDFHDCREYTMFELYNGTMDFIGCDFRNLDGNLLSIDNHSDVSFTACSYDEAIKQELIDEGYITEAGEKNETDENTAADNKTETDSKTETDTKTETDNKTDTDTKTETENKTDTDKKDEDSKNSADKKLISFTMIDHPLELRDEDILLVQGNYFEIVLGDEEKKLYPKLSATLDELNKAENKDMHDIMEDCEQDARYTYENAIEAAFDFEKELFPQRADEDVFSYVCWVYQYMGGAHGYSYPMAKTIDPKTGKDIPFDAVVKKIDGLAEIMYNELIKQNDDLEEYFSYYEEDTGNKTLIEDNKERLKNDGEELCWVLSNDGITILYEDYAMGSYVAGARQVDLKFADYPDYFTDTYVIKAGAAKSASDVAKLETADTEIIKSKEHAVHTIPIIYQCESFEGVYDPWPDYFTSTFAEEYEADENYPVLREALKEYNIKNSEAAEEALDDFQKTADKYYEESGNEGFADYSKGYHMSLRRSDEYYVSFVCYEDMNASIYPERTAVGKTLDTETGEDVELLSVVKDKDKLALAFAESLKRVFYDEELRSYVVDTFKETLTKDSTVSDRELSWCLGYEGLEIFLNPTVNYNFYGDEFGPVKVFIAYSDYPELFDKNASSVPASYAYELELNYYPESTFINIDGDEYEEISVRILEKQENGFYDSFSFRIGEGTFNIEDGVFGFEAAAFIVKTYDGDYFLYLDQLSEDGYNYISIYPINRSPELLGTVSGTVKYAFYDPEDVGAVMTGPKDFKILSYDRTMGTQLVVSEYRVGWDGVPYEMSYHREYIMISDTDITAKKDVPADIVDETGLTLEEGTVIPEGTAVIPYTINSWGNLVLKAEDGTLYRLSLDGSDEEGFNFEGKSMDEWFDGLEYYF